MNHVDRYGEQHAWIRRDGGRAILCVGDAIDCPVADRPSDQYPVFIRLDGVPVGKDGHMECLTLDEAKALIAELTRFVLKAIRRTGGF